MLHAWYYFTDDKYNSKCLWSPKGISQHKCMYKNWMIKYMLCWIFIASFFWSVIYVIYLVQKYMDTVCGSGWDGGTTAISKGDDEQVHYAFLYSITNISFILTLYHFDCKSFCLHVGD